MHGNCIYVLHDLLRVQERRPLQFHGHNSADVDIECDRESGREIQYHGQFFRTLRGLLRPDNWL